ncbi:MAG: glycosyltransferase family 39 protein [Chloroflexaceae bacterium]
MTHKRYVVGLALAILILLALRLLFLRCGPLGSDVEKYYDEVHYIWLATSLANGDTIADTTWAWTRAPATSLVLMALAQIRDLPAEMVICEFQLVQVIIWAGLLLLLATIAQGLFGRRTAVVTALLFALMPLPAQLSLLVYSETLFCAGMLTAIAMLFCYSRRHHPGWLLLAGLAAGAGALARSAMLPILPVLALWAGTQYRATSTGEAGSDDQKVAWKAWFTRDRLRFATLRSHFCIRCALLFTVCAVLVIAPWTIRNYLTYGGLIIVDTTGAYTLWANNKVTDVTVTSAMWAASDNPVERQRYAIEQGRRAISSDPARFVRKVTYNMAMAWRPTKFTSSWDRWFKTLENSRSRTAALLAQLSATLSITLPLAALGLIFAPHSAVGANRYRAVILALALCFMLTVGITHYEERYRLPFFLVFLPYAAWCPAHPRQLLATLRRPLGLVVLAVIIAIGIPYAALLWPAQIENAHALLLHGRGLLRATWGDTTGAMADQRAAFTLEPTLQEPYIAAARLARQQGELATAERLLWQAMDSRNKIVPEVLVPLQQVLLAQGDSDTVAALDRQFSIPGRRRAEELAWRAGMPPGPALDIGADDFGLIEGFYVSEDQGDGPFRWSRPEARMLLAGPGDYLCLRLNAARPDDVPAPVVNLNARITGEMISLGQIHPSRQGWNRGCVPLPADRDAGSLEVHLSTPRFNPHIYYGNRDVRNLGVVLDEVALHSGPLQLDPATGLLVDRLSTTTDQIEANQPLTLIGANGTFRGQPGEALLLTLWWRGVSPPPTGTFTFVHLLDAQVVKVAEYNAPLADGRLPEPWVANEPLLDRAILPLPADLPPGLYRLVGGAFDPTTGAVLTRVDLGEVAITAE